MKTAIFLGSGASASEKAPVQSELFSKYFKLKSNEGIGNEDIQQEIIKFFQELFDIVVKKENADNILFPTFEEALGILDLADIRNESFREISNLNVSAGSARLKYLRLYLTLLMGKTIHSSIDSSQKIHRQLVNNLRDDDLLKDVFFISTNYDILIDNALTELMPAYKLDYGVDFVNFNEPGDWERPDENAVRLFKIHGSLNWLYCPTCNSLKLTPKHKGVNDLIQNESDLKDSINMVNKKVACYKCNTVYSPVIVPPTFYKDLTNVFLNIVWNKTEQLLLETDHLIFCGYSFPDADMHIKYLIKRVQKNRIRNTMRFSVVNCHEHKTEQEKKDEKYRYRRFLGENVDYTDFSFEDFAKNPFFLFES